MLQWDLEITSFAGKQTVLQKTKSKWPLVEEAW